MNQNFNWGGGWVNSPLPLPTAIINWSGSEADKISRCWLSPPAEKLGLQERFDVYTIKDNSIIGEISISSHLVYMVLAATTLESLLEWRGVSQTYTFHLNFFCGGEGGWYCLQGHFFWEGRSHIVIINLLGPIQSFSVSTLSVHRLERS